MRQPPKGDDGYGIPRIPQEWKPASHGIEPEFAGLSRRLMTLRNDFEQTGNYLYVFEAYRITVEKKLYPPIWVLDSLMNRFEAFIAGQGKSGLDEVFFNRAQGQSSPWADDVLRSRDFKLCRVVMKLESLGLTRPQACRALSALLARIPDGSGLEVGRMRETLGRLNLTGKAIENAAARVEAELGHLPIMMRNRGWSEEERRENLSVFYKSELPKKLVKELWPE